MDRREVLKGIGVTAVSGAVLSGVPAEAAVQSKSVPLSDLYKYPGVTGRIPVNRPRAYAVMEEMEVDGLIALDPINVFYLTNTITVGPSSAINPIIFNKYNSLHINNSLYPSLYPSP